MAITGGGNSFAQKPAAGGGKKTPNVIYIYADDMGYAELGCYGQRKILTPNLDRMATEGMRFTQHYTSTPVCAPARCMLLTGRNGGHSYIRGNYEMGGFADSLEGGQMPLHRRLPKRGFRSLTRRFVITVRLGDLDRLKADEIDLAVLKQAGLVSTLGQAARIVRTGQIKRRITVRGLGVTAGARAAIEAAGGSVAE